MMFGEPVSIDRFSHTEWQKTIFYASKGKSGQICPCQAKIIRQTPLHTVIYLYDYGSQIYAKTSDYGITWCIYDIW
jgi:hypothetical protein